MEVGKLRNLVFTSNQTEATNRKLERCERAATAGNRKSMNHMCSVNAERGASSSNHLERQRKTKKSSQCSHR